MVYISHEFLSDVELRQQLPSFISLLDGQEKALQQREAVVRQQEEMLARREAELTGLASQMETQIAVQVSVDGAGQGPKPKTGNGRKAGDRKAAGKNVPVQVEEKEEDGAQIPAESVSLDSSVVSEWTSRT